MDYKVSPNNPTQDGLVNASDTPDVIYLAREFQRSLYNGNNNVRFDNSDSIRYARWAGQSDDGKKWSNLKGEGDQVFPFEGASDVRIRLVDSTINELVATLTTGFERAAIKVAGVDVQDASPAAAATTLMTWLRENKLKVELDREAELMAQYTHQYGWAVAHVCWDQKISSRMQTITMQEVAQIAQQAAQRDPNSILATIPQMIMDEASEGQAAEIITLLLPDMKISDAKKFVRDLRTTGEAEYEEEYVQKNLPSVTALRPFSEIALPPETTDLQRARVIFRREFMTEVELRAKINDEDWNKDFVEAAAATQGRQLWLTNDFASIAPPDINPVGILRTDHLIEVVHAYSRQLNEKGVPGIYYTVFSSLVETDLYAKHELLDYAHGKYPFVEYRSERLRRSIIASRGVAELGMTDQEEIKAQHDSIRDRTAFTTMPPLLVKKRIGQINKIGPGVQVPVTQSDDFSWMPPPSASIMEAKTVIDMVDARHANYFGLTHAAVPAVKTQVLQQKMLNNWFCTWSEIFSQMFQLCCQYMTEEEIVRISGQPLPKRISEIAGQFDFILKFDVRDLDNEYVMKKLQSISQFVVPLDAGGEIDRNKLVKLLVGAIAPDAASEILINKEGASQQMFRQVQSDIGLMMLGNEALYTENDPTAAMKLQYTEQIIKANPKAQQASQADPQFQQLLQNYVKNLQMSQSQQQNKQIGRIGVAPVQGQQQ
tara:strand:+ start:783 stop:2924 length:2142 start_codon:yes stop_codon:yes gene_type:complete